ncbi:hypothetical protein ABW19_dt0210298 [Dactylella cylindrospora]|nr:hypothetical protein ABW19_dt0210298 [Dactylella cylindrospora]
MICADLIITTPTTGPTQRPNPYPSLIMEYSYSATSDPQVLSSHWRHLYSSRDMWMTGTSGAVGIVLLALFSRNEENGKINARMDVWRWGGKDKGPKLTEEVVLFPAPKKGTEDGGVEGSSDDTGGEGKDEEEYDEVIEFTAQEIYGAGFDFEEEESRVDPDMKLRLSVADLRSGMLSFVGVRGAWRFEGAENVTARPGLW